LEEEIKERNELLQRVYEQNWLHARHVENERLWFTNIYFIAVGGSLAFTFEKGAAGFWPWPILIPVFIFSMLGFFMCHHMSIPFLYHSRIADIIQIREWQLPYNYFYRINGKDPSKFGSFSGIFHWFYILMSSFSIGFLMHDLLHNWCTAVAAGCIALVAGLICLGALFAVYECIFKKKEDEARADLLALKDKKEQSD